jgi:hypothetical protein
MNARSRNPSRPCGGGNGSGGRCPCLGRQMDDGVALGSGRRLRQFARATPCDAFEMLEEGVLLFRVHAHGRELGACQPEQGLPSHSRGLHAQSRSAGQRPARMPGGGGRELGGVWQTRRPTLNFSAWWLS